MAALARNKKAGLNARHETAWGIANTNEMKNPNVGQCTLR
jgi:hypothetical protein